MIDQSTDLGPEPAVGSLYRVSSVFLRARPRINESPGWGRRWEMIPNDTMILVLSASAASVIFTPLTHCGLVFNTFPTEFKISSELVTESKNPRLLSNEEEQ
jgi:hypothetical protein